MAEVEIKNENLVYAKPKLITDNVMHYCPGCSHGTVHKLIAEVIEEMGFAEKTVGVSPVGCSVFAYNYIDIDWIEAAHGRALAVATAVKRLYPGNLVFTYQGDGDLASIGTAEIVHAAHRGEHICTIFVNNAIYGMTGGQYSPMTPIHSKATTAPYYTVEPSFNLLDLAKAAGATYVARATTYHVPVLVDVIAKGIAHKGFSIIEAVSACPISFGRQNKMGGPAQMMAWQRDHGVMKAIWDRMDEEKKAEAIAAGKFPIGVLYENNDVMEYTKAYDQIIQRAQEGK